MLASILCTQTPQRVTCRCTDASDQGLHMQIQPNIDINDCRLNFFYSNNGSHFDENYRFESKTAQYNIFIPVIVTCFGVFSQNYSFRTKITPKSPQMLRSVQHFAPTLFHRATKPLITGLDSILTAFPCTSLSIIP